MVLRLVAAWKSAADALGPAAAQQSSSDGLGPAAAQQLAADGLEPAAARQSAAGGLGPAAAQQSAADGVGARAVLVHHTTHSVPQMLSANTLRPRTRPMHSLQVSVKLNESRVHQQSN